MNNRTGTSEPHCALSVQQRPKAENTECSSVSTALLRGCHVLVPLLGELGLQQCPGGLSLTGNETFLSLWGSGSVQPNILFFILFYLFAELGIEPRTFALSCILFYILF